MPNSLVPTGGNRCLAHLHNAAQNGANAFHGTLGLPTAPNSTFRVAPVSAKFRDAKVPNSLVPTGGNR